MDYQHASTIPLSQSGIKPTERRFALVGDAVPAGTAPVEVSSLTPTDDVKQVTENVPGGDNAGSTKPNADGGSAF